MTESTTFHRISAQQLLKDRSVSFSGYLERKISRLAFKLWTKCYVILLDGNIYIYSNSNSPKPSLVCISSAFCQIQIIDGRIQHPYWVFSLTPVIDTIPELKFSAASERERNDWVSKIKASIIYSKNKHLKKVETGNDFLNNNSTIYDTVDKENISNTLKSFERSKIYEETEEIFTNQNLSTPSAPLISLYPRLSLDSDSLNSTNSQCLDLTDKSLFFGNRDEAYKELLKCDPLGSYLVRSDNNREVLTVKCEGSIVKYCILRDSNTNRMYLAGQKDSFVNLNQLLAYYYEHFLPNQNCKLLAPYKLFTNN